MMKIIRQSEVYLMEEAITDQIVKSTQIQIDQNEAALGNMVPQNIAGIAVGGPAPGGETDTQRMGESIVDIQTDNK